MTEHLWERKYELDSSSSIFFFSNSYFNTTNDSSFIDETYLKALNATIKLVKEQMLGNDDEDKGKGAHYTFQRKDWEPCDSLHQGRGYPVATCGLVKTSFRASDDSTVYPYNIPENAFLVSVFENIALMLDKIQVKSSPLLNHVIKFMNIHKMKSYSNSNYQQASNKYQYYIDILLGLANGIRKSIYEFGLIGEENNKYFAYEVDCYGNTLFMDDPGYPSLTSLPFFGFVEKK